MSYHAKVHFRENKKGRRPEYMACVTHEQKYLCYVCEGIEINQFSDQNIKANDDILYWSALFSGESLHLVLEHTAGFGIDPFTDTLDKTGLHNFDIADTHYDQCGINVKTLEKEIKYNEYMGAF